MTRTRDPIPAPPSPPPRTWAEPGTVARRWGAGPPRTRPRVLILTTTFPGRPGDGVPSVVLDLSRKLEDDYDLTVITPRLPDTRRRERVGRITVERFPYLPRPFEGMANGTTPADLLARPWRLPEFGCLLAAFHRAARRANDRLEPDLIHAHRLLPAGLHAVGASLGHPAPVLTTVHGVGVGVGNGVGNGVGEGGEARGPIDAVRRWTLRRTDRVVAVSSDVGRRVTALSPTTAVDVVPMGADLAQVPADFTRSPIAGLVGFVGRLATRKGVDVLLDALARTATDGDRLELIVAGDGPERGPLEERARRLGLDDRVRFLGHADRRQIHDLLSRCETLAIPSVVAPDGDQEGTPVVLAEAVALGVPVVASRLGGIGDHLTAESGWLVPPGDAEALAEALVAAHRSPHERDLRATTARKLVSPQLTLDGTAEAYDGIYRELIDDD